MLWITFSLLPFSQTKISKFEIANLGFMYCNRIPYKSHFQKYQTNIQIFWNMTFDIWRYFQINYLKHNPERSPRKINDFHTLCNLVQNQYVRAIWFKKTKNKNKKNLSVGLVHDILADLPSENYTWWNAEIYHKTQW